MRVLSRLSVLAFVLVAAGCFGPGPHLEIPTPPHERYTEVDLSACFAISVYEAWTIGVLKTAEGKDEGLILSTEDGGRRWRRAAVELHELEGVTFTSVHFGDRLRGWIAGRRITPEGLHRAVVFRTFDGGNHWTESILPAADGVIIEDVHSIEFKSDFEGAVAVTYHDPATNEKKESIYATQDGGRMWTVAEFQEPQLAEPADRTVSFINTNATNGYRLRRSDRPGVTLLETTASAGRDWMPIAEFSVAYMPLYY